jgi:hypothetical protein
MFPPLNPSQVPDIWFCPVCVGRTWHMPFAATQMPPTTVPSASTPAPLPPPAPSHTKQQASTFAIDSGLHVPDRESTSSPKNQSESQNRHWIDIQRWKENAWYAPRGYFLDPSSGDKFIPLDKEGSSVSLSTVIQNRADSYNTMRNSDELHSPSNNHPSTSSPVTTTTQLKPRNARKGRGSKLKSLPRTRSKYSDLPNDIEKAMDLIKSHLGDVEQFKKSHNDAESMVQTLEQKTRIQDGEVLLCQQELQALKERLATEVSNTEKLRAENIELQKQLHDSYTLVERKETEMKNWQNMLRAMMAPGEDPSTS